MDYIDMAFDDCFMEMIMLEEKLTRKLSAEEFKDMAKLMNPVRKHLFHLMFDKLKPMNNCKAKAEYAVLRTIGCATGVMVLRDRHPYSVGSSTQKAIIDNVAETMLEFLANMSAHIVKRYRIDVDELTDANLNIHEQ